MVPGAFGPAVAAFIVLRVTGGSVGAWARQILHWRVQPRWYLYALGLPALLLVAVNEALALLGQPIDLSLLADRAPSYLAALAFITLLGGGQEEPGWRGYALPRLQQRLTPLRATLLLAVLWGLWHLPIYGVGFVGPVLFAVFYTYLYNKTGSVGLCMLLHGSFTAALDNLTLTTDNLTVDLTILATLVTATLILIAGTRGRLGFQPTPAVADGERCRGVAHRAWRRSRPRHHLPVGAAVHAAAGRRRPALPASRGRSLAGGRA
jgi:uncharacterized protein